MGIVSNSRGMGLFLSNQGNEVNLASGKSMPKWLTDAGCKLAINVDRQVNSLVTPNSFISQPLRDMTGRPKKNVFDTNAPTTSPNNGVKRLITNGFKVIGTVTTNTCHVVFNYNLYPNQIYTISADFSVITGAGRINPRNSVGGSLGVLGTTGNLTFTTDSTGNGQIWFFSQTAASTGTFEVDYTNVQLELGSVKTTFEVFNYNNVALQGFTGVAASGYSQQVLANGKNPWFLKFDGLDDIGFIANNADVDITGTNDFAISAVFLTPGTLGGGYLISKNNSLSTDFQYSVNFSTNSLTLYLNTNSYIISASPSIQPNTLYELLIYRISGVLKTKLNEIEKYNQANTINIATQPFIRVGGRSSAANGSTQTGFANIYLGALSIFYNGAAGLDIAKIEKALHKYNINYI